MFKRARSSAVLAVLVLVAGFTIAACGSSSSGSSASASAGSGSAGAGAATTTTSAGSPGTRGRAGFTSLTTTQRSCLAAKGVTVPTGGSRGFGGGTFTRPAGAARPGGTSTTGGPGGGPGGGFSGAGAQGAHGGFGGANSKTAAAFKACGVSFGGGFRGGPGAAGRTGVKVSSTAITAFVACVNRHGYKLTHVNTSGKGAVLPASLQSNQKFITAARSCTSLLRPSGAPGGTAATTGG